MQSERKERRHHKKPVKVSIDFTSLMHDPLQQRLLGEVTLQYSIKKSIPGTQTLQHHTKHKVMLNGIEYRVTFPFDIYQRPSNQNKEKLTWVMKKAQHFSEGKQGKIYDVVGEYTIVSLLSSYGGIIENSAAPKIRNKPTKSPHGHITKVETLSDRNDPTSFPGQIKKVENRYALLQRVTHLGTKPPFIDFHHNQVYYTSRKFPGMNLDQLIKYLIEGEIVLTPAQFLQLTINIIGSYQKQVADCNVVHRDIKPENIMVDPDTLEVNFVDFDLSKLVEVEDKATRWIGTPFYLAPEAFYLKGSSIHTDLYSLGLTLFKLYTGFDAREEPVLDYELRDDASKSEIDQYFRRLVEKLVTSPINLENLTYSPYLNFQSNPELKKILFNLLNHMLQYDKNKRWSLSQVTSYLDEQVSNKTAEKKTSVATSPFSIHHKKSANKASISEKEHVSSLGVAKRTPGGN